MQLKKSKKLKKAVDFCRKVWYYNTRAKEMAKKSKTDLKKIKKVVDKASAK